MDVFIQHGYPDEDLRAGIELELKRRACAVHGFHPDEAVIDTLPLEAGTLILSALWIKLRLLERLRLTDRIAPDYPGELSHLLRRSVWSGSLEELLRGPASAQRPLFVKVAVAKRIHADAFDPQIVESIEVLRAAPMVRSETQILGSEPVEWIAEWRVYVCNGEILDTLLYSPSLDKLSDVRPEMLLDLGTTETAVRLLSLGKAGVAGYALDFGVLRNGETSLIEMNDGLALVNYGLSPAQYIDLHLARWRQLMASPS